MAALVNANGVKFATFDGGTTRATLAAVLSYTGQDFYEIELVARVGNTGTVYLGPVTVDNAGTDAVFSLLAGASVRIAPGQPFLFNLAALYAVGSAASQKLDIRIVRAAGRRAPLDR